MWCGTWRSTFLRLSTERPPMSCRGLYSDVLHRPWQCAHLSLTPYAQHIPPSNAILRFDHLSSEDFKRHAQQPFILTQPVKSWLIYRGWSISSLLSAYGDTAFRAEAVDWSFKTYMNYMQHNQDESPLYRKSHNVSVDSLNMSSIRILGAYWSIHEKLLTSSHQSLTQNLLRRWG